MDDRSGVRNRQLVLQATRLGVTSRMRKTSFEFLTVSTDQLHIRSTCSVGGF